MLAQDGENALKLPSNEIVTTLVNGRFDISLLVADCKIFLQHIGWEVAHSKLSSESD